jgi:hypothetical protein
VSVLVAIVGAVLIFLGELFDGVPVAVSGLGVLLFLVGIVWLFVVGIRMSRREGMGFGQALFVSAKDSLRFAFHLFP